MKHNQISSLFNGISCVFPCFNEELNIARAITSLTAVLDGALKTQLGEFEIIVVNDGSSDRTGSIVGELAAADPRLRLISFESNQGYGAAVLTGLAAAKMELVFFSDSDNQFDYAELAQLLPFAERYDAVCGYRKVRRDPWMRKLNAFGWSLAVRMLFGYLVRDLNCAFKLFRRSALERIDVGALQSRGALVNTELLVRLRAANQSIVEVPVTHLPRVAGTPTGANPRVILRAFAELFQLRSKLKAEKIKDAAAYASSV